MKKKNVEILYYYYSMNSLCTYRYVDWWGKAMLKRLMTCDRSSLSSRQQLEPRKVICVQQHLRRSNQARDQLTKSITRISKEASEIESNIHRRFISMDDDDDNDDCKLS